MTKTILITGSTDGIGYEAAKALVSKGHSVLIHGRSTEKLERVRAELSGMGGGTVKAFRADLSDMTQVVALADAVKAEVASLDVLINNAGILKSPLERTAAGLDIRFAVNTLAPALLTKHLLPIIGEGGRVLDLSSAAQAPVSLAAMAGEGQLAPMDAYSQSKLALTMWSAVAAKDHASGPVFISINPGSLLATKMVQEGFGIAGNDIGIGSGILVRASLDDAFSTRSGQYFDNDAGDFGPPHADARDAAKSQTVVDGINALLDRLA